MRNHTCYWAPDGDDRGARHGDHFARSAREDGSKSGRVTPGAITDIGGQPDKTVTPGDITDIATPETAVPPGAITDGGIGGTGRDAL